MYFCNNKLQKIEKINKKNDKIINNVYKIIDEQQDRLNTIEDTLIVDKKNNKQKDITFNNDIDNLYMSINSIKESLAEIEDLNNQSKTELDKLDHNQYNIHNRLRGIEFTYVTNDELDNYVDKLNNSDNNGNNNNNLYIESIINTTIEGMILTLENSIIIIKIDEKNNHLETNIEFKLESTKQQIQTDLNELKDDIDKSILFIN